MELPNALGLPILTSLRKEGVHDRSQFHRAASRCRRARPHFVTVQHSQSVVAPDSLTSLIQNFESSPRNAAKSSGERDSETSVPSRASAALTSGFCAASVIASNSLLTISGGVPTGTKNPYQNAMPYSGKPASAMPGRSVTSGEYSRLFTASPRSRPALIIGSTDGGVA